jgi:Phosphoesterase family/Bacterial Ig-like domain (group 3)
MRRTLLMMGLLASLAQGQSLKHIVIIVKENRSFDHYFGQFPGVTGGPVTSFNCVGPLGACSGGTLAVIPSDPTQADADCGHSFYNSTSDYDGGLMDRFNQNCSNSSDWAKQYSAATIPTYWSYAKTYGLADHMFASVMGPSYPNHLYIFSATSNEAQNNPGMVSGKPPNGTGANDWSCDAFHYGRCSANGTTLCSKASDCTGLGSCIIDSGTGHCSVSTSTSCTLDSDCSASGGGYCSNGNTYTGTFYGIDLQGGTGNQMYPGVCSVHRTVGCNSICTVAGQSCSVTTDCLVTSPTSKCNIADPACGALSGDVCDASSQQFLSAARGSACPNVTTIADRLQSVGVSWGMYYSTGNTSTTDQKWNPVGYVQHLRYGVDWSTAVHPSAQFVTDAASCTSDTNCSLPSVVWVTGADVVSEHPPNLVATGEAWTATQVNAVMSNSYLWSNSTVFITWDDFGGFADHLAPSQDAFNWSDGIRVPLLCVGRFCKNQITSTVFTHASMLKCIEDNFGVSALVGGVDGAANDACFGSGGMMSLSQNNPFPAGATTTTVASSLSSSVYGQAVSFSATVTANVSGTPTGSVAFSDGSTLLGTASLSAGVATFSTSALTTGQHSIAAVYNGNSSFNTSSGFLNQTVTQASTALTVGSNINPSVLGQSVTITAAITTQYGSQATGTVAIADGSALLGSPVLNGNIAKFSTSALAQGTHSIVAAYAGDANSIPSTSSALSQVVTKAASTTMLASSLNPSGLGQSVTFTATVSSLAGTPAGDVSFEKGSTVLATVSLSNGVATYTTTKLPLGSNSITAVYAGDGHSTGSTSAPVTQIVLTATTTTLTSSPNPSTYGQAVGLTATVTSSGGAPPNSETVTFKQGTTVLGTGYLTGGKATFTTSTLAAGTKSVTAVYVGDSNFATSTSKAVSQVIAKASSTTALTSSQNPSSYGQSVTFTATVAPQFSGTPTGTVTFKNGSATLGSATLSNGVAKYATTKLAVGTAVVTAAYNGSNSFLTSTSTALNQVVNQAGTTTKLSSSLDPASLGQSVTITAAVAAQFAGTVPGSVTFLDGTTTLKTVTLSGGKATLTTSTLASGAHNITANYGGSSDFTASSASMTETVNGGGSRNASSPPRP